MSRFGCPRLNAGFDHCWYGCTSKWPMCHKFKDNKCYAQDLPEWCSKGWHVRENDRRIVDKTKKPGAGSTPEPVRRKRRRENDESAKKKGRRGKVKLEERLSRLGFYNSTLPLPDELETTYTLYRETVEDSAIADEDKRWKLKKLKNAFTNICKASQGERSSPSSSDSEAASSESESAAEQTSSGQPST